MRRTNRVLAVAIIVTLLVPGFVVGALVEACCGVQPTNLVVTDAPDPVCAGGEVTINGTYTVTPLWTPWEPYDTGVDIRVWDPTAVQVVDETLTLATGEPDAPKDFTFSYPLTVGMGGSYTYEVVAWSVTYYGREEANIVAGDITVEAMGDCLDCLLEKEIRDRWEAECDSCTDAKNHGAYVSCRAEIQDEYLMAGLITAEESSCLINPVAKSDCGFK